MSIEDRMKIERRLTRIEIILAIIAGNGLISAAKVLGL